METDFIHGGDELSPEKLEEFIRLHQAELPKYEELENQYRSKPPILEMEEKETWKPDNRLVVNFARKIVETFNGYFLGIPVKISHDKKDIDESIKDFWNHNDMDDKLAELGKMSAIYGKAYLYHWQNENAHTRVVHNSPKDMFIIYDDTIEKTPIYGVRYGLNADDEIQGTLVTLDSYIDFEQGRNGLVFSEETAHYYPTLPIIEFVENAEKQSLIEPIVSLINAFNKAISEKANDVDYFADAYLAILGAELDEDGQYAIRDNRLINIYGETDVSKIVVEFLEKPDGDTSQENLLDRIEKMIYDTSMVVNINDESLGNDSGTAMEIKMTEMKNMAASKERKFTQSLNRLFRNFFALPTNVPSFDYNGWADIEYTFTRNMPKNLKDEAELVRSLTGVTSKETALNQLSVVDNAKDEMERIEEEKEGGGNYPVDEHGDFVVEAEE